MTTQMIGTSIPGSEDSNNFVQGIVDVPLNRRFIVLCMHVSIV